MSDTVENYPIINVPFLYKYGLAIQNSTISPQTNLSILAGTCRDSQDITDIRFGDSNPSANDTITTAPVRINNTINGAGGLDEGAVGANVMYAIYIIADSRGYLPISAIATFGFNIYRVPSGPLMPSGYDSKRLIGFWATDSSKHWLTGYYYGLGNDLVFTYDVPQATLISAGSSNSYVYIDLFAPPYGLTPPVHGIPVAISTIFSPGSAGDTLTMAGGYSQAAGGQVVITGQVANVNVTTTSQVLCQKVTVNNFPTFAIQYKVSGTDTVAISVAGFSVSV